jgi:hypothetical protein
LTEDSFLSASQVEEILYELEQKGLVFKTWDIKKNNYVWHMTESGNELAEKIDRSIGI